MCVRGGGVWGHRRGVGFRQINTFPAKYLYWSVFEKSRHLGLVSLYIFGQWSLVSPYTSYVARRSPSPPPCPAAHLAEVGIDTGQSVECLTPI